MSVVIGKPVFCFVDGKGKTMFFPGFDVISGVKYRRVAPGLILKSKTCSMWFEQILSPFSPYPA